MSNYPLGAKDDFQEHHGMKKPIRTEEIEVEVVLTVSKNVTLKVPVDADNMDINVAVGNYVGVVYNDEEW